MRPAIKYGAETRAVRKSDERRRHMRMDMKKFKCTVGIPLIKRRHNGDVINGVDVLCIKY